MLFTNLNTALMESKMNRASALFQKDVIVGEALIVADMVELVENTDRVLQNLLSHLPQFPLLNDALDVFSNPALQGFGATARWSSKCPNFFAQ